MKTTHKILIAAAALFSFVGFAKADNRTITAASLLNEMIDRDALAVYPSPDYHLIQASSYDPLSVAKDQDGWFANGDCDHFIYEEDRDGRHEYVMMDRKGPGAIVRFWMTFAGHNGGSGTMRIYIDDMENPVISGTPFDILSGGMLVPAPLSDSVSPLTEKEHRGHNLYYPLVYSKQCKITYESDGLTIRPGVAREAVYYNIDFREYAPGTRVQPFSWEQLKKDASLISKVNDALAKGTDWYTIGNTKSENYEVDIRPGESISFKISGPRAITRLEAMLEAHNKEQALRSTVVEIVFDGNSTVWCPFGDFMGIGYKDIYTSTWMTKSLNGRYTAAWVMPFRKECEFILHNYGSQMVTIKGGKIVTKPWHWTGRSMYFGTNWSTHTRCMAGDGIDGHIPPRDIAFTRLSGKGVYMGDAVALFDTSNDWWGEGDEKAYVDGETFPSSFGTGSEDYYGYAWCRPEVFTGHPFIAQPSGSGNLSAGYTSNSRFRSLDRIPFRTSLAFDLELWHWGEALITYAPTSFWYILPGGSCEMERQIDGIKEKVTLARSELFPPILKMVIEGEDLQVDSVGAGITSAQQRNDMNSKWSGSKQLWWRGASVGDKLTLSFISPAEGCFKMSCILTKAIDYASSRIELNGKVIAENVNLQSDVLTTGVYNFGNQEVLKGSNTLTVTFVAPPKGYEKCMWGIDKLEFSNPD